MAAVLEECPLALLRRFRIAKLAYFSARGSRVTTRHRALILRIQLAAKDGLVIENSRDLHALKLLKACGVTKPVYVNAAYKHRNALRRKLRKGGFEVVYVPPLDFHGHD